MDEINEEVIVEETITEEVVEKVVEEKPKKKPKKEKKVASGLSAVTCVRVAGSKEEFELDLTKEKLVTFSSFKEKGTVIKVKGASVKYIAYLAKDQFDELVKLYK